MRRFLHNPECLGHEPPADNPEQPERLKALLARLELLRQEGRIEMIEAAPARFCDLRRIHPSGYVEGLESACLSGRPRFMSLECPLDLGSTEAILAAAGSSFELGRQLAQGHQAFALTRPPGHHAAPNKAEGFCFTNHGAAAAWSLRQEIPGARILHVDIDLHHGNGTQAFVLTDPNACLISLHADPLQLYPGSGFADETGGGTGQGILINRPLPEGCQGSRWLESLDLALEHSLLHFGPPDAVLVAFGLDGHKDDPFAFFKLEDNDFFAAYRMLRSWADMLASGRLGLHLEGGYNPAVLERVIAGLATLDS
ncbi:MAG: hypothetical protein RL095_2874 [Verrucomicrobiota bacterium]|jgi:acetoin utilization deacetylase AcuC-like enzyme